MAFVVAIATASIALAQAPAPRPGDKIVDHDGATPARRACFEFLTERLRNNGKRAQDEHPDLNGRNICLYARKFGYTGKVE